MLHRLVRAVVLSLSLMLSACVGPPAPDAELCRDVIARLCAEPTCPNAQVRLVLPESGACVTQLEQKSGCDDPNFTFTTPTRARVLECRLPLVRESDNRSSHPSCDYVDETLRICPDLVTFLGGRP